MQSPHIVIFNSIIVNLLVYLCDSEFNALVESIVAVPMVQSETELVHILLQVFHRNVVEYAVHRPFQNRPTTLNAVGVLPVTEPICIIHCITYICFTFNRIKITKKLMRCHFKLLTKIIITPYLIFSIIVIFKPICFTFFHPTKKWSHASEELLTNIIRYFVFCKKAPLLGIKLSIKI